MDESASQLKQFQFSLRTIVLFAPLCAIAVAALARLEYYAFPLMVLSSIFYFAVLAALAYRDTINMLNDLGDVESMNTKQMHAEAERR